jgi:gamma-glutamylcyclotransferase (GGCT)/AIG2-like uncharacterized protein YtfP
MESVNILVYGTLMQGYRNHFLIENQKYLGNCKIKGFEMYHVHSFPGVVEGKGQIQGEVYQVDDSLLPALDKLESIGSMYDRKEVEIEIQGKSIKAWIYTWLLPIEKHMEKVDTMPWRPRGFKN